MAGELTTRQDMLDLETTQVCEPTRLGEGKFVALKQQHSNFLAQFRFRHTRRLQQRIWYSETHASSPLNGMVRKTFFSRAPNGIGRGLTASPLPHHRTDGSRLRRFGRLSQRRWR